MWPHGHYINNIFSISFRYVFAFVIYSVAGKLYNAHDAFVRIAFTAHNLIVWCAHIFECDVHSQAAMLAEMHKTHLVSANYNILIASNESAFMSFPVGVCVCVCFELNSVGHIRSTHIYMKVLFLRKCLIFIWH